MRRADRLFQIIQVLRRSSRPITAEQLAAELEISKRTVYRDISDLMAQRVPITGEAGFGYVLDRGYDMPPLMLTPDELEAVVLGAQWVAEKGDRVLAAAARDLVAKITVAVPDRLRPFIEQPSTGVPAGRVGAPDGLDLPRTRLWIRDGKKISIRYRDEHDRESERLIWPVIIGYAETVRLLAAWCELRQDFRHFRTDRVVAASFLDDRCGWQPPELRRRWKQHFAAQRQIADDGKAKG
jgi:predicted DNA-binding transcriptional regulator YafY